MVNPEFGCSARDLPSRNAAGIETSTSWNPVRSFFKEPKFLPHSLALDSLNEIQQRPSAT